MVYVLDRSKNTLLSIIKQYELIEMDIEGEDWIIPG